MLIRNKSDSGVLHFLIEEFSPMSLMTFSVHFFDEDREACFSPAEEFTIMVQGEYLQECNSHMISLYDKGVSKSDVISGITM